MGNYRIETRTVAAAEVDWRLDGEAWRLGEQPDSTLGLLPDPVFVPSLPPPPLESIRGMPLVEGIGVPWGVPTTIREQGRTFIEEFRAGAFGDNLRSGDRTNPWVPSFFNHGSDPSIGMKSLGRLQLWEDNEGLRFQLAPLDADYVREVIAGIEQNVYGMSVRFGALDAIVNRHPGRSRANPDALETRQITKARLVELSVVVAPAYPKTSATLKTDGRL